MNPLLDTLAPGPFERLRELVVGAEPGEVWIGEDADRRHILARGDVVTGFITLLAQDGVPCLQAPRGRPGPAAPFDSIFL